MPDNNKKFDLVTTELDKTASALKELQALLEKYKSASDQMEGMKSAFIENTNDISTKFSEANDSIKQATVELKPIGTVQITDALKELKTDFETASTDLKSKLATLDTAVENIEKSGKKIDGASTSIPTEMGKLIEGQNIVLLKAFTDIFETDGPFEQLKSSIAALDSEDGQLSQIQSSIKSMTAKNSHLQKIKNELTSHFPTLEKNINETHKKNKKSIEDLKNLLGQKFLITYAAIAVIAILLILNLIFK